MSVTEARRRAIKCAGIAIVAALLWLTGSAMSQGSEAIGPYALAGLGATRWHPSTDPVGCVTEVIYGYTVDSACTNRWDGDSVGVRLGAGWRFNRWLAAETAFAGLGDASADRLYDSPGVIPKPPPEPPGFTIPVRRGGPGRYRLGGAEVALVASLPVMEELSLIARVGGYAYRQSYNEQLSGGRFSTDWATSRTGFAPVYGLGIAWRAAPALEFRAEWTRYQNVGRLYGGWLRDQSGIGHFDVDAAWINVVVAIPQ